MSLLSTLNFLNNTNFRRYKTLLFFISFFFFSTLQTYGQNELCANAADFCAIGGTITYDASTNAGTAPAGNNYGCLGTQPNPAWFLLEVSTAGNIVVDLNNSAGVDIDFALWGPYPNDILANIGCGSLPAPVDCSYSTAANEQVSIANGVVGDIYILLITNFSNTPTQISGFDQLIQGEVACNACLAEGGELDQPDVAGCLGDPALSLNLTPTYTAPNVMPPSADYGYTYLVSSGGTIFITLDGPDLGALPPGDFTICGLSYDLSEAGFIATSIGQTVANLQTSFDNETAFFCGDISDDCFDVSIGIPLPPIVRDTMACIGSTVILPNGDECDAPGSCDYFVPNGTPCPQQITYIILPFPINAPTLVTMEVCEGECVNFEGEDYCDPLQSFDLEDENGCDSLVILTLEFIAVNAEVAAPDMLTCTDQMVTLDGSTSTGDTFEWRDADGNLLGTNNTLDVTAEGCYTLTAINSSPDPDCTDTETVCVTQDAGGTPVTPVPAGTTPVCVSDTGTYSVTGETDVTYNWTVSANGTIASGQSTSSIEIDWTNVGTANVCVTAENTCGLGEEECFTVTINGVPTDPVIMGDTPVCPNADGTYSVAFDATATDYDWTVPAGASIASGAGTASITVTFGNTGGDVCVTTSNACGDSQEDCFPVALFDLPATANVTGTIEVCAGETVTYTTPDDVNTTDYDWTVPSCATIDSGQGSNTISVTWGAGCIAAGDVCVEVSNDCGTGTGDCLPVLLNTVTEMPEVTTSEAEVCDCDETTAMTTEAANATNIVWTVPAGATIISGQGTANIEIDWCNASSGDVCATLTYECGTADDCTAVMVSETPDADAGTDDDICGLTYELDATPSVSGSTGTWSYSGAEAVVFLNTNMPQTEVTVPVFGTYTFIWTEDNNSCTDESEVTIDFNSSPIIDGIITETCNGVNTHYTVTFEVTGGTAPYTAPDIAGTFTGNTFTSAEIISGGSYAFTIIDDNGCISQEYNGMFTCNCDTDAGTMDLTPLEACEDELITTTHNGDENLDDDDTSQFILHDGNPITGTIFATNNTGIFGLVAPMIAETTYFVSFAVGDNDGAGNVNLAAACADVTEGTPIVFHAYPEPDAGDDDDICGLTYDLSAMPDFAGGSWSQLDDGTGTSIFTDMTAPNTSVTVSTSGTYTFIWSENNGGCEGTDEVMITFNPSPMIDGIITETCNDINTDYTVTFEVTGGTAPYTAPDIAGTFTGNIFTSAEITTGGSYTFTIIDNNGCISQEYTGMFTCDCDTDAGTMDLTPLEACDDQTVTTTHNGDENLDGNDITQYILHDGNPITGTIFATNNTGIFGLVAPMAVETTYFVSFAVGDDDGTGNVNLTADCAEYTEGTPILFHAYPMPSAGDDDAICSLTYELMGTPDATGGSWSQTGGAGTATFADANVTNTTVTVSAAGDYAFTWTENVAGCVGVDEVNITFNLTPSITGLIEEICNNTNTAYIVIFTVVDGAEPYTAPDIAGTFTGNVFTSEEIVSGDSYTFTITDSNGCTSQEYTGSHICDCDTDAGTMLLDPLFACVDQTVTATHNGDEVLDGDDASQYILHDGNPLNGVIFDTNTTGIFGLVSPMIAETTYFISLIVGDSDGNGNVDLFADCAGIAPGQPVTFNAYPAPDAGDDDEVCGFIYDLSATPEFGGGTWSSPDATVTFASVNDANTSVTVTSFGTYAFTWTEINNDCEGSDVVEITFNDAPQLAAPQTEVCDLVTNEYTVTFSITGGEAPYSVDGTVIAGTDFISNPIGSNIPYTFTITDNNGCGPITVTGVRNCDCQSEAGTMMQMQQEACIGDMVSGLPNGDTINDGDDAVQYILHDGNGTTAGMIFGTSNMPDFALVAPMQTGETYYISTIIGNDLGDGTVDLNDPCLRVAVGTPVVFNPLPEGSISGDTDICENSSAEITFNLVGTPPFNVVFDGNTLTGQAASFTQTVTPTATTDYSLTEVTDANGCTQTVNSTVTITVNTPPTATLIAAATVCNSTDNGNPTTLNFANFIEAGDATGSWEDTDDSGATGSFANLDFTGATPGNYTFTYTTAAADAPCSNVSVTMTVIIEDCECPSVATSAPQPLCNDGGTLDLSALQVTTEAGTWMLIDQPNDGTATLNGNSFSANGVLAGEYTFEFTLTNTPPDGCPTTSQEVLTVNQAVSAGIPNAALAFCEQEGNSVDLTNEIMEANLGGTWTETSASPSTGGAFNTGNGTFNPNGQAAGIYTFAYTVTGVAPCSDDVAEVTIVISPIPTADAGQADEITCLNEEVQLGGSGSGDNIVYSWEGIEGGVISEEETNIFNPVIFDGGTYILTVTDELTGCSDTDEVMITESVELPMPFLSLSNISCFGNSDGVISIDSVEGGSPPYVYSIDGENFSTNTFFSGLSGGDYLITVQDANGCSNSIMFDDLIEPNEVTVELYGVLEGDDNTITFGDSVLLGVIPSVDFDSLDNVIWTPSDILDCDTCVTTWAMPLETTNFSVTIDDNGCTASDDFTLIVKRDTPIFVPNIFSPNGDGNNDLLYIFAGDQVAKINSFLVFDRWGETVHQYYQFFPNDPAFGWDGTWRGQPMNPAVFAWYAEVELIDGRTEILEGDVTLVR